MKDITVAVEFFLKTGSEISEKQIVFYEFAESNNFLASAEIVEIPAPTAKVGLRLTNVFGE